MGREPERDVYFWIQFGEMWKSLAELAGNPRREECLKKAAACLRHAGTIRQRIQAAGRRREGASPIEENSRRTFFSGAPCCPLCFRNNPGAQVQSPERPGRS